MSLRVILVIDDDKGIEELTGLLAKGMHRGELGIKELRIEQFQEPQMMLPTPPTPKEMFRRGVAVAKAHGLGEQKPKPKQRGRGREPGVNINAGAARIVVERLTSDPTPMAYVDIRGAIAKQGYKPTTANGLIERMKRGNIIKRVDEGYVLVEKATATA